MRVFVTGNTGFKGAWLGAFLRRRGAQVSGFALPPSTEPNLFTQLAAVDDEPTTFGDIRDLAALEGALVKARPEVVFHLAAQAIVRDSIDDPLTTFSTNVIGTANLLDAVRRVPSVRAVVVVTSDKCYENVGKTEPYREGDPMGGHDPYSASKGAAELVTASYRRTYFSSGASAIASARAGNVIGGGDWSRDRLVPDIVRALRDDCDPVLRFPTAVRPWQHVLDAINGYVILAEALLREPATFADGWNLGPPPNAVLTVAELTDRFLQVWGSTHRPQIAAGAAEHEARTLALDATRANRILGWTPRLDTPDAVDWTAEWYRGWLDGEDSRTLVRRQIDAFEARATSRGIRLEQG